VSVFELISVAVFAIQLLLVWIIFPLRTAVDELRQADEQNYRELKNDVQSLQVKVAENYVQRGEVTSSLARMEHKIDALHSQFVKRTDELQEQKADK
jgi:septal ring factor EnvC (AmiA/AmiB activator)